MKIGLYAGSFDPWSIGHQYVLQNALDVFDAMHVLLAVHPSKKNLLEGADRARLVAHANDPTVDWWNKDPKQPFVLNNKHLTVSTYDDLVAEYAHKNGIHHLVRGMRSTTDFEAEFNLYFSNYAIDSSLNTWAIMCPPKLLYCSATYIRAVVGHSCVKYVGTSFAAQALMLNLPVILGQAFDLHYHHLKNEKNEIYLQNELIQMQQKFTEIVNDPQRIKAFSLESLCFAEIPTLDIFY